MWNFWRLSLLSMSLLIVDQMAKGAVQSLYQPGEQRELISHFISIIWEQDIDIFFNLGISCLLMGLTILFWKKFLGLPFALVFTGFLGHGIDGIVLGHITHFMKFQISDFFSWTFDISRLCLIGGGLSMFYRLLSPRKALKDRVL